MYRKIKFLSIFGFIGIVFCVPSKGTEEIEFIRFNDNFNSKPFRKSEVITLTTTKKNAFIQRLNDFIEESTKSHPLDLQNIDQARKDLEALDIYENTPQLIEKASLHYDPASLGLVGAAYANNFRIQKALPWLFASAKGNDPDSLWLLSSLYRRGIIHSENPQIADQLKEKAFILKGNNAREYFGEK